MLKLERARRSPAPSDRVLCMNAPITARTRKTGGCARAHPHWFRDTFAVDMLARGASPHDVAKLHYAEFVKELRERIR